MNTNLSEASLAVLEQYRRLPGVQAQHHRNLLQAIQASPLLVEKFNSAVAENKLKGIFVLPENSFAGGLFDPENQAIGLGRVIN
ncbi:hypothetical protein [Conchiformibius kuhniae]|uniref:Uncharacterized protein n=1 Tax=Conchiformibius kuhniae TaxID=211502 RepID=A0A8T9MUY3_9NEIS|nr:hypothetical protein [Conchiformibius kuhniae]UOP04665.1 hypothetical protein LVJ77_10750 [Conchiformibius kuhniae]